MKKLIALLSVAAMAASALAMSSCALAPASGSSSAASSKVSSNSSSKLDSSSSGLSDDSSSSKISNGSSAEEKITAVLETEEFTSQLSSLRSSFSSVYSDINAYADGSTLVYDYQYVKTIEGDALEEQKAALDENLSKDSQTSTYTNIANKLQDNLGIDDACVRLIYRNGDGTIIYQKDFYPD